MTTQKMAKFHDARYPFLWVTTTEEERIIRENRRDFEDGVNFFAWDLVDGYRQLIHTEPDAEGNSVWVWVNANPDIHDPNAALVSLMELPEESVIFIKDFHRFMEDISICRQLLNAKDHLKSTGKMIVFLAAETNIPAELRHDIQVIDFEYPGRVALQSLLETVAEDNEVVLNGDTEKVVDAMQGMTMEAAENALAYSLVTQKKFDVKTVLDQKAALLKSGEVLRYGQFRETFDDLYGLEVMKDFVLGTITSPEARGILIYGVPGCGKSHFAKAVANTVKWALLEAQFNNLRSKYQGQAEGKLGDMLKTVEAFGRVIVFADELDKAVAGSEASDVDGGVGSRILGELLKYWQDRRPGGSYWICTCNSLDDMLTMSGGAMVRRFDAIFFADMPTKAEARGIARIWSEKKGVQIPKGFDFSHYTGADIAKLATNMAMLKCSAEEAATYVIPYGRANGAQLKRIREKAAEVCIWASKPEVAMQPVPTRKVKKAADGRPLQ